MEKNHLGVLRDPLGHQGLWILLGQEKKEKNLLLPGKGRGKKPKDGGPRTPAVWTANFTFSK